MEDKELIELFEKLNLRMDALKKPPEDPKEDVEDPRLVKASTVMRVALKENLTKEKLDAMSFDELVIAMTLKEDFAPAVGVPPPTGGQSKEDALKAIPDHLKAHYPETGALIE